MAEFGDQPWEIDRLTIPALLTRLAAVRIRQRERRTTLEAHQHFAALQAMFVHNSTERLLSVWAQKYRPRFIDVSDLIKPPKAFDEEAFRQRQRESYDKRLKGLLSKPHAIRARWCKAKDGTQEGYLLREAAERYSPAPAERDAWRYIMSNLRVKP